jgi:hypothetical protein
VATRRACLVAIAVTALTLAACGSGDDDALSGVWTGAFRDSLGGLGGGTFTLSESGGIVSGSWQVIYQTFAGRAQYNNSGSLNGTLAADLVAAQMTSQSSCVFVLQATRSGRHMAGSYESQGCATAQNGTVDLEKE